MGDGERDGGVLLHQQDGRPLPVDLGDGFEDLLDQEGCKPHRGFVQQEDTRSRHERATDRQHLLLPP